MASQRLSLNFKTSSMTSSWRHRDVNIDIMRSLIFELFKVMSLEEYQARTNKFMDEIAATSVLPDILAYVRECTTCSVLPKVTGDMSGDVMPPQVRFHISVQQARSPDGEWIPKRKTWWWIRFLEKLFISIYAQQKIRNYLFKLMLKVNTLFRVKETISNFFENPYLAHF